MKTKTGLLILILVMVVFALAACTDTPSSDQKQQLQQEKILQQITDSVGMPDIHNFFEKKTLKSILEKRDDPKLTTYIYTESMDGHYVYVGRSIGYGVPYSTQFTNPQKSEYHNSSVALALPQADPNGLFSPGSANATWLLYVDEKTNESGVMYMEPNVIVTETKLPKRLIQPWSLPDNY